MASYSWINAVVLGKRDGAGAAGSVVLSKDEVSDHPQATLTERLPLFKHARDRIIKGGNGSPIH